MALPREKSRCQATMRASQIHIQVREELFRGIFAPLQWCCVYLLVSYLVGEGGACIARGRRLRNGDRPRVPAHGGSSPDSVSAIDPSKIT